MMGRVWISLGIICFLFLTSCDGESVFAGSEAISTGGWEAGESVKFEWQVKDTLTQHDFFIDLRHDQSYPFSNIYLFVDFTFPNGKNLRDTISCNLADERGVWLGTGFGNLVDHRIGFRKSTSFPVAGDYSIEVAHGMRETPLRGMRDVGFRLEKSQQL